MASAQVPPLDLIAGRYALYDEIASGGMATVHIGRLLGPAGFTRTVAIKKLHSEYSRDPDFVSMFLDEARLAARIQHPNVVPVLDVVADHGELLLVMEYVQGESLSKLMRMTKQEGHLPPQIASSIVSGALTGLHAAHEARSDSGEDLGLVHRDVSPQNIIVGADGLARMLDFGIAKASRRVQTTQQGVLKGKLSYMAPEQLEHRDIDRRTDIFAAGVVLWEVLTGLRLFEAEEPGIVVVRILNHPIAPPSEVASHVPAAVDDVVLRALARHPDDRYRTAREMAVALERAIPPASAHEVSDWIERIAGTTLAQRAKLVASAEKESTGLTPPALQSSRLPKRGVAQHGPSEAEDSAVPAAWLGKGGAWRWLVFSVGAIAAVALGVLLALVSFRGSLRESATPSRQSATIPDKALKAPPSAPEVALANASAPDPAGTPSAPTEAQKITSALPPRTSTGVRSSVAPTAAPSATAEKPPRPPGCNPPYTVEADGTKHFKPECF